MTDSFERGALASAAWRNSAKAEREAEAWRAIGTAIDNARGSGDYHAELTRRLQYSPRTLALAEQLLEQLVSG